MKAFQKIILTFFLCATVLLGGCATLSYVGDDYNSENTQTVKTNEELVFSVYKKTTGNANVKIGISRTPVPEVLALYVQIENLSYETPYTFYLSDLELSNPDGALQFVTSNNYLSVWQNQEAASMSQMSAMGSTLTTMTGMNTNYNDFNQSIVQNSAEATSKSAFSRLETLGTQILKHSIKHSATISPRRSQYFYFFFQDYEKFPIIVTYKNLKYQFKL